MHIQAVAVVVAVTVAVAVAREEAVGAARHVSLGEGGHASGLPISSMHREGRRSLCIG